MWPACDRLAAVRFYLSLRLVQVNAMEIPSWRARIKVIADSMIRSTVCEVPYYRSQLTLVFTKCHEIIARVLRYFCKR